MLSEVYAFWIGLHRNLPSHAAFPEEFSLAIHAKAVLDLLRDAVMNKVTAFMGFIFLVVSSAWAQTPPATPGAPPAGDAGGGIMDYWWVILLIIIVIAAIWYFSRRGRNV
jgi:small-conductance mechanosensitive channel